MLECFHANKVVFVDLGIQMNFMIPKLHLYDHYGNSIRLFSTTDNYDTQYTECLHIDFTKDAYCATNYEDKFPQMTLWLKHCKKVLWLHRNHLQHNQYLPLQLYCFHLTSIPSTHHPIVMIPQCYPVFILQGLQILQCCSLLLLFSCMVQPLSVMHLHTL